MGEAIDGGEDHHGIWEDLLPFAKGLVGRDERQVFGVENVVLHYLAGIRWNTEQAGALIGSQDGSARHWISGMMAEGRS